MTIASEISRIESNIANAYTQCGNKWATIPSTQNSSNLANCIASIKAGVPKEVSSGGVYQNQTSSYTFTLPSTATNIGDKALYYAFYNSTGLTSADLSSLTSVTGTDALRNAFEGCTNLTSVDLSSLASASGAYTLGYICNGCTNLATINISNLASLSGNYILYSAFKNTGITSLSLPKIEELNDNQMMYSIAEGCTSLASIDFSGLETIAGTGTFNHGFTSSALTSVSFPELTTCTGGNAFYYAFENSSNLTSATFPKLEQIGLNTTSINGQHFGFAFNGTSVTTLTFPELTTIYATGSGGSTLGLTTCYGTFVGNTTITKMYFPKLTTITFGTGAVNNNQLACKNIFKGCTALTELHFGSANQAAIEATTGYATLWGLDSGQVTVYFDL